MNKWKDNGIGIGSDSKIAVNKEIVRICEH